MLGLGETLTDTRGKPIKLRFPYRQLLVGYIEQAVRDLTLVTRPKHRNSAIRFLRSRKWIKLLLEEIGTDISVDEFWKELERRKILEPASAQGSGDSAQCEASVPNNSASMHRSQ